MFLVRPFDARLRALPMPELNLVLLGSPGSGKGTQGERLQEDFRLPYYATGDILRAAVREGTELGGAAKEYMDRGDLVPDEVMVGLIAERVSRGEASDGFILDGFPRTTAQAEALDSSMQALDRSLTVAVVIEVADDEVVRRLSGRRTCVKEGHIFHVEFDPPKNEDICDICGARLEIRDDDKPDVIRNRLRTYHDKTEPLVAYYEERGILRRVDGSLEADEVTDRIRAMLATLRMEEEL
jgi:adenylate kinase